MPPPTGVKMDSVVTGVVSGVAVLFIGALAWLAYNHPEIYRKLSFALGILVLCAICASYGYDRGIFKAAKVVSGSWSKLEPMLIPSVWLFMAMGFSAYTVFLGSVVVHWKGGGANSGEGGDEDQEPPQP
jgi:hypothetical protein